MSSDDQFPSGTESQDENLLAAHYDHTDLAQFPVYGLGLSISPVSSASQLSTSNDSPDSSNFFSPPPTLSKDPGVRNVFAHLFNVLKIALAAHAQQIRRRTGDSLPTPSVASVILDIISYLKRSVRFDSSIISHLDLDVPEVLKSCDLSSMLSTYVDVTSPSTLRASSSDALRRYHTRIERLLSDYPVPMQERLAALVSIVSGAFFSLVSLMTVLTQSSHWVIEQTRLPRATRLRRTTLCLQYQYPT